MLQLNIQCLINQVTIIYITNVLIFNISKFVPNYIRTAVLITKKQYSESYIHKFHYMMVHVLKIFDALIPKSIILIKLYYIHENMLSSLIQFIL